MPESEAGKGGDRRPMVITQDEWDDNYNRIYRKKEKSKMNKYETKEEVMAALSKVDPLITDEIENCMDDYDTPMECVEDQGGLCVEMEAALELAAKHGKYPKDDEDPTDDELDAAEPIAVQFVRDLLKEQVPEDFPYAITHEQFMVAPLWSPKSK